MKLRSSFLSVLLVFGTFLWAAAPSGYYTNANGKNTSALRSALEIIITNGQSVTSYAGLWTAYATTDINLSTGNIWDMYSNCSFTLTTNQCGTYLAECGCYNREHSVPQSWFGSAAPMVSDAFHIYPTDGKVNGMRSNYPYGEVGSASYISANGSQLGTSSFSGYSGIVFEPIDEYKGDFARTYFYMATRYSTLCGSWTTTAESTVVFGTPTLGLSTYAINLFLKWSRQDPVSAKEIARNEAVYGVQNNRNPYIDYPALEEFIWGNNTSSNFSTSVVSVSIPTLTTPSSANITSSTATLGGNITSLGNGTISESGIYYSTSNGFTDGTGTKVTSTANLTGTFTSSVTNLAASTTYYFKAYAINTAGTGYSTQGSFSTSAQPVVSIPTLTTPSSANITSSTATLGGNITSLGNGILTESGVFYSTTSGFSDGSGTKVTSTANSTGAYTTSVSNLAAATNYYFKAYAANSAGVGYSSQGSFVTTLLNGSINFLGNQVGSGSTLAFGTVTGSTTKTLKIKTNALTGDLTVAISGSMYKVSVNTIAKADAEVGFTLLITYNPTASGTHSGIITILGGGLTPNYTANLTGKK